MLIAGCGCEHRGDDAAGLLVARRLRQLGIDAIEHTGDAAGLLELFGRDDDVLVIDAVITGARAGEIVYWNTAAAPLPSEPFACSSHVLGVAEAVELARVLGRLPRRLRVAGIEARCFDLGAPPSPPVLRAVERLASAIAHSRTTTVAP